MMQDSEVESKPYAFENYEKIWSYHPLNYKD
jgi:hypothetical protein